MTVTNVHEPTVAGFGQEWSHFDQSSVSDAELALIFASYFAIFPWHALPEGAVGFDLGCGSGRWARFVAPRVGTLHCVDASPAALAVAKRNLAKLKRANCRFHLASVDRLPFAENSMDFGYSLGVLHHVPDTGDGIRACVSKLKPGAPFLLYLYYAFENRPRWFRRLWQVSDAARRLIASLPARLRYWLSTILAATIYFPLARISRLLERRGRGVALLPLAAYRNRSFYTMRTDALDRFGTQLEQRFTAAQIRQMMEMAGLAQITFSPAVPYWCAIGYKRG